MVKPAVRRLEMSDVDRASDALGDAFEIDPFSRWLFGERNLNSRLRRSFRLLMRVVYACADDSYTTDDAAGAALWSPPERRRPSTLQQARLAPGYVRLLGPRIITAGRAFAVIERHRPQEPHWYLDVLGVEPSRQRTGIGGALIEPVLQRGELCYLETAIEANVPYYERFGFAVTAQFDLCRDGPRMWGMTRES